jgi:hypothetical protein
MVVRDDMEVLKDEFKSLKTLSDQLETEVALFNYQFFTHPWSDQGRRQLKIELHDIARKDIVDSITNTFDMFEVIGHHQADEDRKMYVLSKEQFPNGNS